jgi:hypothetical protein
MSRPRAVALAGALLAAVILSACGDEVDGSETAASASTTVESAAAYDIDVEEFVYATDKKEILKAYVEAEPNNCSPVDDGFVLTISSMASDEDLALDTPLHEVIVDACGEPDA